MKFRSLKHVEIVAKLAIEKEYKIIGTDMVVSLKEKGFEFKWDNKSIKRFGVFKPVAREIMISRKICEQNLDNGDIIYNTILHEIAHGLHFFGYNGLSHDQTWVRIAKSIGCDGNKYYNSSNIVKPKTKYSLVCPHCGKETPMQRKPKRTYSCGKCSPGKGFDKRFILKLIQNY